MAPWVLLSFVGPVVYVANALIISLIKPPPSGALPLAGGVLTTGAIFMFVVRAATDQWWWFEGPVTTGDWALVAAAAITALVFYLMVEIIRLAGPVFFTTVNFMIPLTGIGWGVLYFRRTPQFLDLARPDPPARRPLSRQPAGHGPRRQVRPARGAIVPARASATG